MSDLVAFLTARYDEVEAEAKATADADAEFWADVHGDGTHFDLHSPARVLRGVDAKRKILAAYVELESDRGRFHDPIKHALWTVMRDRVIRPMYAEYGDHPDCDQAWC